MVFVVFFFTLEESEKFSSIIWFTFDELFVLFKFRNCRHESIIERSQFPGLE